MRLLDRALECPAGLLPRYRAPRRLQAADPARDRRLACEDDAAPRRLLACLRVGRALRGVLGRLIARVRGAARAPGAPEPDTEIERKYLLRGIPALLDGVRPLEIDQGWLPGERLQERVRRTRDQDGERWHRTVKVGRGVQRIELEEEASPELGEALWALTEGRRVRKQRYRVPAGDRTWEIDRFLDRDLVLAEVELPTPDVPVEIPDWLAPLVVREVTGEGEYVNINLAG